MPHLHPTARTAAALGLALVLGFASGHRVGSGGSEAVPVAALETPDRRGAQASRPAGSTAPRVASVTSPEGRRRPLDTAVSTKAGGAPSPGGSALVAHLASADVRPVLDPHEATLAVELLLELERPLEAYAILRAGPAGAGEAYGDVGLALAELGRAAEASYLFSEALRRGEWDEDLIESFVAVDPAQCLAAIEREGAFWASEGYLDEDDTNAFRAEALHALGRSEEAIALLGDDMPRYVESSGCVPGHLEGDAWAWRAWMDVDPRTVEPLLLAAATLEYATNVDALELVAELYVREGRSEELERVVEAWSVAHDSVDDLAWMTARLAPQRGWDTARAFLAQHPAQADVAWALGEHLLEAGREADAVEVLRNLVAASWEAERDVSLLVETCRMAPRGLAPALDRLVVDARAGIEDAEERSDALGGLGDACWDLGQRERAQALWREAHALDPEQGWAWSLRQAELGVDPRW